MINSHPDFLTILISSLPQGWFILSYLSFQSDLQALGSENSITASRRKCLHQGLPLAGVATSESPTADHFCLLIPVILASSKMRYLIVSVFWSTCWELFSPLWAPLCQLPACCLSLFLGRQRAQGTVTAFVLFPRDQGTVSGSLSLICLLTYHSGSFVTPVISK